MEKEYEYYLKDTDTTYTYDEAVEYIQENYFIIFDYTKNVEEMDKQNEVIELLLTNIFEIIEKQAKEYEKNGVHVLDYVN